MLALFQAAGTRRSVKFAFACCTGPFLSRRPCSGQHLRKERVDETNPQMDVGVWRGRTGRRAPSCLASANAWRGIL